MNLDEYNGIRRQYDQIGQAQQQLGNQAIGLGNQTAMIDRSLLGQISGQQIMQQMADTARARYEVACKPTPDYFAITREVSA